MEEKKLTDEKVNATVKSLKWICNQIPQDLGDSNEEKMLKCIRLYCEIGIAVINQQKAEIERLTKWYDTQSGLYNDLQDENAELQKQVDELKLELQGQFDKGVKAGCLMSKVKEQQAVKDTAKEILQKIMNIIKKSDGFLAEEVIRIMAKQRGVEVE